MRAISFSKIKENTFGSSAAAPSGKKKRTGSYSKKNRPSSRITVMLIPHSDRKPFNFQISLFSLIAGFLFAFLLMGGFLFFALKYSEKRVDATLTFDALQETETNLDTMRQEVKELLYTAGIFNRSLNDTMNSLNLNGTNNQYMTSAEGDLASFFNIEESDNQTLSEISDLQRLKTILSDSTNALDTIQLIFTKQSKLLAEIPSLWPVQGGLGYVSTNFGPAINPFDGNWYIHRGIDISYTSGVPVIAPSNGKIIETGYHPQGYGYYVEIRHRYGFYTKYGHLQRIYAYEGQEVSQGDIIGIMGNTGQSTGRHLHYEVRIGTQLVDPSIFLDMGINKRKTFDLLTSEMRGFAYNEK